MYEKPQKLYKMHKKIVKNITNEKCVIFVLKVGGLWYNLVTR